MSHRIPLVAVLFALLTLTLLVVAVMTLQGADLALSTAPGGGPQRDWGWQ